MKLYIYVCVCMYIYIYIPYFPAHKTHFFPSFAPSVGIISKLINTRTSIIYLYREIVKTTMKMILVAGRRFSGFL